MTIDHRFAAGDFALADFDGLSGDLFKGIHVVEIDIFELVDGGIDVARHGQVDQEKRAFLMFSEDGLEFLSGHDRMGGGCGANQDIDFVKRRVPVVEMHSKAPDLVSQSGGAIERAVRNDHRANTTRNEAAGHALTRLTRAENHDLPATQVSKDFACQVHRHRAHGCRPAGDLGLRAHFLGDAESVLEKFVQMGVGGSVFAGGGVGLFDLTEDLGFPDDHGIEPAYDSEKMADAQVRIMGVKGQIVRAGLGAEVSADPVHNAERTDAGGIKFHTVAGRNNHRAKKAVNGTQLVERILQLMVADGEFLANFHRGIAVIDAGAKNRHFVLERCWITGRVAKIKVNAASERIAVRRGASV